MTKPTCLTNVQSLEHSQTGDIHVACYVEGGNPPPLKVGESQNHFNNGFKNFAVCETLDFTTCSGVPSAIIIPPPAPPSGPKSITQSAVLITLPYKLFITAPFWHEFLPTFFLIYCIGKNVAENPTIYRRILEEGHAVGNHTFNHLNGWMYDLPVRGNGMSTDEEIGRSN